MFGRKKRTVKEEVAKELSEKTGISEENVKRFLDKMIYETAPFNSKFIDLLVNNEKFINAIAKNDKLIDAIAKKLDFKLTRRLLLAGSVLSGLALGLGPANAKLVLTDKFIELNGERFYPSATGSYSIIIRKDESNVWAENEYGKTIIEGEANAEDSKILQNAIDYLYEKGGGLIKIASGEYYIGDIILKRKVSIHGEGYSTILKPKEGAETIFKWEQDKMGSAEVTMYNLKMYGENTTIKDVFYLKGGFWFKFICIHIDSFDGTGFNFAYVWDSEAISCFVRDTPGGIILGSLKNTNGVKLIAVHACPVYLYAAARIYIDNCRFETGDKVFEYVLYCDEWSFRNFICNNTIAGNVSKYLVHLGIWNVFIGNELGTPNTANGIYTMRSDVRIIGNQIKVSGIGIYVHGTSENLIIANNVIRAKDTGIYFNWQPYPFVVEGNIIKVEDGNGIHIRGDNAWAPKGIIANNIIKLENTTQYGIAIYHVEEVYIKGNIILGGKYSIYIASDSHDHNIINNRVEAPIKVDGSAIVRHNVGYTTENSGTITITGDGTTQTFTVDITHGLVSDKLTARITLDRDGTVDKVYLVDKDGDGFKETIRVQVTFATAPADGESVPIYWYAEVVQ